MSPSKSGQFMYTVPWINRRSEKNKKYDIYGVPNTGSFGNYKKIIVQNSRKR